LVGFGILTYYGQVVLTSWNTLLPWPKAKEVTERFKIKDIKENGSYPIFSQMSRAPPPQVMIHPVRGIGAHIGPPKPVTWLPPLSTKTSVAATHFQQPKDAHHGHPHAPRYHTGPYLAI
jgi:hypothetical protein